MAWIYNVMHDEGFQKKLLNTDGTLNEQALAQLYEYVNKTSTEVTNLSARLNKKVNVAQGTQNAGKFLSINKDGNVTPAPLPTIPIYGIAEVATTEGYLKTYQLYSVADGKTTYHDTKINIPRDFFLKDVELVDVTESSPLEGYEIGRYFKFTFVVEGGNERIQILPVGDLAPCVDAGKHITIDAGMVNAHSFVPQYDSVDKVLPEEKIFQYTGTSNSQFHHGYVYERGSGFVVPAAPNKGNITFPNDTNEFLQGTFWDNGAADVDFYYYKSAMRYGDTANYGNCIGYKDVAIGDVISTTSEDVVVTAIESDGSVVVTGADGKCHITLAQKYNTRQFVSETGEVLYYAQVDALRVIYCPAHKYKYRGKFVTIGITNAVWGERDLIHDIVVGSSGWHQLDVQPREEPFDPLTLAKVARTGSYDDLIDKPISEGSTTYWNTNKSYIPKKGEIIIYTDYEQDDNKKNIPNFKVGDGKAYVIDLPFAGCDYLIKKHISDKTIHHEIGLSMTENECLIIT